MPATILLVEDEVLVRWSLAADLVDMNFEVLEAGTVKQAIEMLEQHASIELMFSDIKLPGILNGIDLARTAMKRWPYLKIIMTSAMHSEPKCLWEWSSSASRICTRRWLR